MAFPVDLTPPLLQKAAELNVRPEDVEENFIRGSGHGGQKINKTASCVQLIHHPSQTEVRCQEFREQHLNRQRAWKQLILKVEEKVKGAQSERGRTIFKLKKQKQRRSKKAQQKIVELKRERGEIKAMRRPITERQAF
jgi:peptide chain release factor